MHPQGHAVAYSMSMPSKTCMHLAQIVCRIVYCIALCCLPAHTLSSTEGWCFCIIAVCENRALPQPRDLLLSSRRPLCWRRTGLCHILLPASAWAGLPSSPTTRPRCVAGCLLIGTSGADHI